ncbi:MAG TPA: hypothetical protein DDW51_13270 [Cyanobacteria bacterium UBA11367]|nr:hypothetical protein [Cyanobacteria bacterium UBA11367]HBE60925.1 hypothetical protein [Cyanobacteria bacterium UBA11366]HBK62426.1 hypothetical protein [Cyanobacteria bacterium UBA11166]HCA95456.1 hypothetical protein [Cyanobacteria bacterium UBA9226]
MLIFPDVGGFQDWNGLKRLVCQAFHHSCHPVRLNEKIFNWKDMGGKTKVNVTIYYWELS